MAYDRAKHQTDHFNVPDLATADQTFVIRGSKGKRGRLRDIEFTASTATAGDVGPRVQLGVAGNLTKFADFDLGGTASPQPAPGARVASAQSNAIKGVNGQIQIMDYDTDVVVTVKAATGAGKAGAGRVNVFTEWF